MASPFKQGVCARCGGLVLDRPDNLPLCSECERKMTQEFTEKIRPDLAKKGPIKLFTKVIK